MASNTSLNNQNNVQQPPIAISNNNGLNEINIKSERKENSQSLNKEINHQSYPLYNIPNNYAIENENIKQNRKRHLSNSSNTSISSHTLINNNVYEKHVSNNPNVTPSQYQRDSNKPIIMTTDTTTYNSTAETTIAASQTRNSNINNSLPMCLYNNSQNPSEKIYSQNKNKKQKIDYSQIPQNQCAQQIDQKERVDSFNNDNIKNDNNQIKKEFDIPNSMNYIYTREVQPSLIQNSKKLYNVR